MSDFAARYEAFQRRDPALGGVIFVAVKTTEIYCRPVCRARTPFARNVEFNPAQSRPGRPDAGPEQKSNTRGDGRWAICDIDAVLRTLIHAIIQGG